MFEGVECMALGSAYVSHSQTVAGYSTLVNQSLPDSTSHTSADEFTTCGSTIIYCHNFVHTYRPIGPPDIYARNSDNLLCHMMYVLLRAHGCLQGLYVIARFMLPPWPDGQTEKRQTVAYNRG